MPRSGRGTPRCVISGATSAISPARLHHHLRREAAHGRCPAAKCVSKPRIRCQRISTFLQCVVEGMAHMHHAGHVGGGDHDGVRVRALLRVAVALKLPRLPPNRCALRHRPRKSSCPWVQAFGLGVRMSVTDSGLEGKGGRGSGAAPPATCPAPGPAPQRRDRTVDGGQHRDLHPLGREARIVMGSSARRSARRQASASPASSSGRANPRKSHCLPVRAGPFRPPGRPSRSATRSA